MSARRRLSAAMLSMVPLIVAALPVLAESPVKYDDYDEPPKLSRLVKPKYPAEPFSNKVEGTVEIEFVVDEKGPI